MRHGLKKMNAKGSRLMPAAWLAAWLLLAVAGLAQAQETPTPAGTPGASGEAAAQPTPEELAAQQAQIQAQIEADFRHYQCKTLVDIARGLNPPPRADDPSLAPLWMIDRRIALLEAGLRIESTYSEASLELYGAYSEAAAIYRGQARQAEVEAAKARAAGQGEQAETLDRQASQANSLAERYRLAGVEALARYVDVVDGDVAMWEIMLGEKLALLQTAPERIAVLEKELVDLRMRTSQAATRPEELDGPPPEKIAHTLTLLADYRARRLGLGDGAADVSEDKLAEDHPARLLAEAVKVMPLSYEAKLALAKLRGQSGPAVDMDLLLTRFRTNPLDIRAVAAVGATLSRYGVYSLPMNVTLGGEAVEQDRGALGWLRYEGDLYREMSGGQEHPADWLVEYGKTMALAGRASDGVPLIRKAIAQTEAGRAVRAGDPVAAAPPINLVARMALADALERAAQQSAADKKQEWLGERQKAVEEVLAYHKANKDKPGFKEDSARLALLSWFYLRVADDSAQALAVAQLAEAAERDSDVAQRSLGAALAMSRKPADQARAVKLLVPLARANDPWAKFYLAQTEVAATQPDAANTRARELYTELAKDWPGHPAGLLAIERLKDLGAAKPAVADMALRQAVQGLPAPLFDFYRAPGKYASVEVSVMGGQQLRDRISLIVQVSNKTAKAGEAGGFPITIGEGMMVAPALLISAAVQVPGEEKPRIFRDFCTIRLGVPLILEPGQVAGRIQTVDIGPLDQLLRLTPQAASTVMLSIVVNPAPAVDGGWTAGPGGYVLSSEWPRVATAADNDSVMELYYFSANGSPYARIAANRLLGSLLAEQQLAKAKRVRYNLHDIPIYRITGKLDDAAASPQPEVRAFLTDALYPAGLDRKLREKMLGQLNDANWLVRFMAVRLVGDRLGKWAIKQVTERARNDAEPLVRRLAQSYLDQWSASAKK